MLIACSPNAYGRCPAATAARDLSAGQSRTTATAGLRRSAATGFLTAIRQSISYATRLLELSANGGRKISFSHFVGSAACPASTSCGGEGIYRAALRRVCARSLPTVTRHTFPAALRGPAP